MADARDASYEKTFEVPEYHRRLAAVRERMGQAGVETLLVHTFANIFYLIGHQTTGLANYHCLVIPARGEPFLVVRRLEWPLADARSEEHTSELQSLMRISYAVFCLKKKNTQRQNSTPHIAQKQMND